MTYFKSIMLAGAVALSGVFSATNADALFVSGTFDITAYNYTVAGNTGTISGDRGVNSQATAANFNNISGNAGPVTIGTVIGTDSFTYTGMLNFRVGTNRALTTIRDFLGTGTGTLSDLDPTFGGLTNSVGQGNGDSGADGAFITTTLYRITARALNNINDLSLLTFATHDDGLTVLGANGASRTFVGPNGERTLQLGGLTGGASDFTLYYASANGDPSILEVNAIPLPAAAWLLLGVAGALVAAKRRSNLRAA